MYQDLIDQNRAIIEAYGAMQRPVQGWSNTGPVAHIGGHTVDLVRNWKPDDGLEFYAHVYRGDKKVAEKLLFSGHYDDTNWNEQEAAARKFLVDYTTLHGMKS